MVDDRKWFWSFHGAWSAVHWTPPGCWGLIAGCEEAEGKGIATALPSP